MSFINNILYVFEHFEHCEIWLPVEYPKVRRGLYQVSSSGRIRNVVTGKVLKDHPDKGGYRIIYLATEALGEGMTFKVHRIVATAFILNPDNKPEVNHTDGDKTNNSVTNLEWATTKENQIHAYETGLHKPIVGEDSATSIISNADVHIICKKLVQYEGSIRKVFDEVKDEMNVSIDVIKSIKYKQTWRHISDKYFDKMQFRTYYTEEMVHDICRLLLENNGAIKPVIERMTEKYPEKIFTYRAIQHIRLKNNWKEISDLYFTKDSFIKK